MFFSPPDKIKISTVPLDYLVENNIVTKSVNLDKTPRSISFKDLGENL